MRVFDVHAAGGVGSALQAEVKPLFEMRCVVGAQRQVDVFGIGQIAHDNRAGIKLGGDFHDSVSLLAEIRVRIISELGGFGCRLLFGAGRHGSLQRVIHK